MALVLNQRVSWRLAVPVVIDGAVMLASVTASAFLLLGPQFRDHIAEPSFVLKLMLIAAVFPLALYLADLYDVRPASNPRELMAKLVRSLGITSFAFAALYAAIPTLVVGRGVFALAVGFIVGLVPLWRIAFDDIINRVSPGERILFLGTKPAAVTLAQELMARSHDLGVEVVGFIEPETNHVRPFLRGAGLLGTMDDILQIVADHKVDRVVVSLQDARGKLPMDDLLDLKLKGVRFDHLASVYEEFTGRIAIENLRPSWMVFSEGFRKPATLLVTKRAMDLAAAGIGLAIGAPLMLLVAIAVKMTSRGPVFYHQTRVGERGRNFIVHKFRTMKTDAETASGPVFASLRDPRVTPIGEFLRKTRLDELPQLWNILRGEMSLVGPRPERPEFVSELTKEIPFYGQRHVVKPGLTGWAQVRYAYAATTKDSMEKLQFDLFYIKNMSIVLDLIIAFSTFKTVIRRRGSR
jgi:sugar transferase (PEP-CTERM system associated)